MKPRTIWIAMMALGAFVAVASAQEPAAKPADAQSKPAADAKTDAAQTKTDAPPQDVATAAKGTTADDPDYVIGVEDNLMINVWHEPEISKSVMVRPDGKISLPLLGDIEAD